MRTSGRRNILILFAATVVASVFIFRDRTSSVSLEVWPGQTQGTEAIAWSPDGRTIATGGWDKRVRLWDAKTGAHIRILPGARDVVSELAFSTDSRMLAAAAHSREVLLWGLPAGPRIPMPQAYKGTVTAIAFSNDGKLLATGGHEKLVVIWDIQRRKPLRKLWGFKHWVGAVAFSPDDLTLAVGDYDGIRFYDVLTGAPRAKVPLPLVHWLEYSPDGRLLVAGGSYGAPNVVDMTGLTVRTFLPAHKVTSIGFSPDGKALATGGGDQLKLWNPLTGKELATLSGGSTTRYPDWMVGILPFLRSRQGPPIRAIAYSPDGTAIAAACPDNRIRVWRNLQR